MGLGATLFSLFKSFFQICLFGFICAERRRLVAICSLAVNHENVLWVFSFCSRSRENERLKVCPAKQRPTRQVYDFTDIFVLIIEADVGSLDVEYAFRIQCFFFQGLIFSSFHPNFPFSPQSWPLLQLPLPLAMNCEEDIHELPNKVHMKFIRFESDLAVNFP